MVATTKGRFGPYQQFLAVMAALALVLAAGITASATVREAARNTDSMALERQRQVLAMNRERLRGLDDAVRLKAAGRALGLEGLTRLAATPKAAALQGLALQPAGNGSYFAWRPEQPGARLLALARPGFAVAGGLLLLFAFTALWLTRTGIQRIADERARAEFLAHSDHLTGLANRRVFNGRIAELLRSRRVWRSAVIRPSGHRPRPLQGAQRPPRPCRRRQGAGAGGAAARAPCAGRGDADPAGR